MTKQQYDAAVMALGGKTKAEREHPWEFAAIKRDYAPSLHGAAKQAVIASASFIESKALARGVPRPPAMGGGGGR